MPKTILNGALVERSSIEVSFPTPHDLDEFRYHILEEMNEASLDGATLERSVIEVCFPTPHTLDEFDVTPVLEESNGDSVEWSITEVSFPTPHALTVFDNIPGHSCSYSNEHRI